MTADSQEFSASVCYHENSAPAEETGCPMFLGDPTA